MSYEILHVLVLIAAVVTWVRSAVSWKTQHSTGLWSTPCASWFGRCHTAWRDLVKATMAIMDVNGK